MFLFHALLDGLFQCYHCVCRTSMCSCTMNCWMVCFNAVTVFAGTVCVHIPCTIGWSVSMLSLCFRTSMCSCTMHCCMVCFSFVTVFAGPVCVPVPCTVGWSVSVLSLCFRTSMCSCTMYCWMVCFNVVTMFQDQYVILYHALLDGLFQCCHCVCRTSMCSCAMHSWMVCFNVVNVFAEPVCVPVSCTVGWSVSMLSMCFRTSMCSCTMHCWMVFQCCHCVSGPECVPVPCTIGWSVSMLSLCFRTSMCSCTKLCWMVCFNVVTVFQDQYVFLYHALLDGLFQCCHCVSGPVCVPVPCSVGWSVSMLSLCFRTSMCSCTMNCCMVCSVLSLCFKTSMCSCAMHSWMVCFNVVTVFQDQYVFLHHALLYGLFQCCHCVSGPVCVPVPCSVGWSVSVLSLCFRTSMCSCTMLCWMVCFNVVTMFQDQYVFLYHALLDGLFQCCHCVSGPVCVPVPCSVGWSVSMLSLCFRTSMCSCTMHCWMVCFNVVTVFQDQYVFLYHELLYGLFSVVTVFQDQYVFLHHALLYGLFQCCHCVSGPVCVPVPCSVGWSVSMLSLCL